MPKKEVVIKNVTILAAYLLVIWGFYRFLFKLPEEVEELFIKPLLWLTPVIYLVRKERSGIQAELQKSVPAKKQIPGRNAGRTSLAIKG